MIDHNQSVTHQIIVKQRMLVFCYCQIFFHLDSLLRNPINSFKQIIPSWFDFVCS